MLLDAAALRAEADAHAERLRGALWAPDERNGAEDGDDWTDALRALPGPSAATQPQAAPPADSAVTARLDSLDAAVAALREELRATIHVQEDPLAAVAEAAGDPRTYDAPDARRVGVFVRLLPELRRAVADVKARRGLRSDAGAWEYVVRLGIASAARL